MNFFISLSRKDIEEDKSMNPFQKDRNFVGVQMYYKLLQ